MKKLSIILFIVLFDYEYSVSQIKCDIKENYGDFIRIRKRTYEDRSYLDKSVIKPNNSECFEKLLVNTRYISYLLSNFSSHTYDKVLIEITDSTDLHKKFIQYLQNDTLFNKVMTDLVSKTIERSKPKDTVSMDELLDIAVKFFLINEINEQGHYVGKICIGINSIKTTEKIRNPQLEAFCFMAIFNNLEGKKFNLYEEFVNAIKELYKVNLGIDKNERLYRAQGAMFFLMRNNDKLRLMLKSEYKKNKDNLPFILTNK